MKFNIDSFLKDKYVLYFALFLSVVNFFAYLMARNFNAITFFILAGLLTTYFSKNMVVVLLVALISTNLVVGTNIFHDIKEGLKNKKKKKPLRSGMKSLQSENILRPSLYKEKDSSLAAGRVSPQGEELEIQEDIEDDLEEAEAEIVKSVAEVDVAKTLEKAIDNVDRNIGQKAISRMNGDTQSLLKNQKQLMDAMKNLQPMMKEAMGMLGQLEGMGINVKDIMKSSLPALMNSQAKV